MLFAKSLLKSTDFSLGNSCSHFHDLAADGVDGKIRRSAFAPVIQSYNGKAEVFTCSGHNGKAGYSDHFPHALDFLNFFAEKHLFFGHIS